MHKVAPELLSNILIFISLRLKLAAFKQGKIRTYALNQNEEKIDFVVLIRVYGEITCIYYSHLSIVKYKCNFCDLNTERDAERSD